MESQTKNKKTPQQIITMVERAFDGIGVATGKSAITELKDGWFNVAYCVRLADGRDVILKIAPPQHAEVMTYEQNLMRTEVNMMRLVSHNPVIPVPAIYYFDTRQDLCDSDYFFMEKIAGDNLDHIKATLSPQEKSQIDAQGGVIIREINNVTGTYFGYDGNPDLQAATWRDAFIRIITTLLEDGKRKHVPYFGYSADAIHQAIHKHAPALDAVQIPRLVHWDAWDGNLFVQHGKITGIIDFERALWGDPLMEVLFRPVTTDDATCTDALKGYGKTEFSQDEVQRCHLYTLYLGLIMHIECYYRHYQTDYAENLITSAMNRLASI
jgi:aminoglycoside phosphotransferase (APT) family kinase protein